MKTKKVKIKRKKLVTRVGYVLCIILKEGKGSKWIWVKENEERFDIEGNTYFKHDAGTYLKGSVRFFIFLEGISLPIHHGYIEYETVNKQIVDRNTGDIKSFKMRIIKGLKFDSKVINMILTRNLADQFTRQHLDLPNLAIIIMLVVNIIISLAGIGVVLA